MQNILHTTSGSYTMNFSLYSCFFALARNLYHLGRFTIFSGSKQTHFQDFCCYAAHYSIGWLHPRYILRFFLVKIKIFLKFFVKQPLKKFIVMISSRRHYAQSKVKSSHLYWLSRKPVFWLYFVPPC